MINLQSIKETMSKQNLKIDDKTLKELRTYLYFLGELQIEEEKAKEGCKVCVE